MSPRVIVVGGGAAGFFGAIACAEANPHCQVTLLEAGKTLLAKVRISGGGRCNVTHACFEPGLLIQHYPRGGKALRGPFSQFQPRDMVAWLQGQQVRLKTEADGRMFPVTDDSDTIVQCLLRRARALGIKIFTGATVTAIQRQEAGFAVGLRSGKGLQCDRILLATGGSPQGWRLAKALGHHIVPPVPSLFTFKVKDPRLVGLAGISVEPVEARLVCAEQPKAPPGLVQTGPLLVTHWGVSGPAILKLSAWGARVLHDAGYCGELQVNWLPQLTREAVRSHIQGARTTVPKRRIGGHCPVEIPQRLWQRFVAHCQIPDPKRWADLSKKETNRLVQMLSQDRYAIQGKGVFKEEFVTCGGIPLKEVNFKTLESRCCPGLHFAGEVLDIDGVTGGFNFQNAWTTSWLAGQNLSKNT